MEEFNAEVNRKVVDEVILSIQFLMNGVNMYFLESCIGIFHRKIMNHPCYVRWVVSHLFKYEIVTSGQFCKLLERKSQITPESVFGYYRHELQYELKRNKSEIARQVNSLRLEQENLDNFIRDYDVNSEKYVGSNLANVLDKPELFRYVEDFLRI